MITDAEHFKVCKDLLTERYGSIDVVGLFIARRIRPDVALDFQILEDDIDGAQVDGALATCGW